jgi:hypothetical protein
MTGGLGRTDSRCALEFTYNFYRYFVSPMDGDAVRFMFAKHTGIQHIFGMRCLVALVSEVRTLVAVPSRFAVPGAGDQRKRGKLVILMFMLFSDGCLERKSKRHR